MSIVNKCPVCGEEIAYLITINGNCMALPRMCACKRAKKIAEDENVERIRKAERARDIINDGYLSTRFVESTFAMDDKKNPKTSERMERYCSKWGEMKQKNVGLYLFGNTGSGKTFYASAVANYVRKEIGDYVLIGSSSQMIQEMVGDFGGHRKMMEYKIAHYPLMVIDDLGTENKSEYNLSAMEQIIDMRLGAKLPLIVTSNYSPKDLYADGGLLGERIKSRLSEMCVPLAVVNDDRRRGKASERSKE